MDVDPQKVLRLVKRPRWARHLLEHERNERVINTGGAYYWMNARGKLDVQSGLCPHLSGTFWPHTSYAQMMKNAKRSPKGAGGGGGSEGRFGGLVRGSRVHKQMQDAVRLDAKTFKKIHKRMHNYTQRLLRAIVDNMKLLPFLTEFDCADETMGVRGVGTSIDQIALDADGHLVLIEVKTGYRETFTTARDGNMRGALWRMPCTPHNQASLQITAAALILHKRYGIPLEEMRLYVLRIDDHEVEVMAVKQDFVERLGDEIYNDLLTGARHSTPEKELQ